MKLVTKREVWEMYAATWGKGNDESRRRAYKNCLAEECVYTDPNVRTVGYDELAAYMAGFQQQLPGAGFATAEFSEHHDAALVRWDMVDGEGNTVSPGTSFGSFGEDGRLTSMTGFFAN